MRTPAPSVPSAWTTSTWTERTAISPRSSSRRRDAALSALALLYAFWLVYAGGIKYLLLGSLLYAPGALNHPGVRAVHDWLVEEAGIFRALHPLGEGQL